MSQTFDVIIIGGSAAGLSAAMTLARSLRDVLVIDSGNPCNISSPRSHNFITQDGKTPKELFSAAKEQVMKYPTVTFLEDRVMKASANDEEFLVECSSGRKFTSLKILLTTGLTDISPDIPGFSECWGISILHCPYCHGYEVRGETTAVIANGEAAYHTGVLLHNWTDKLTVLTNGPSELRREEHEKLEVLDIKIIDKEIMEVSHQNGQMDQVIFADGTTFATKVMYASIPFRQQSDLAEQLGCQLTPSGHIVIDEEQRTTVKGVYAAGDNTAQHRAIAVAAASGTRAGFVMNVELIIE
jgi:thioredoxin reductase